MMVNALLWATAIVASLIILHDTNFYVKLFPILAGGACVASVACSVTWKRRQEDHGLADKTPQPDK
jgi:hypothetical protein